jgi:hypothetical protein
VEPQPRNALDFLKPAMASGYVMVKSFLKTFKLLFHGGEKSSQRAKIIFITLPKSGTHFIQNFLPKFGYKQLVSFHSGSIVDKVVIDTNLKKAFSPSGHLFPIKGKVYHVDSGVTLVDPKLIFDRLVLSANPGCFELGHLQYDQTIAKMFRKRKIKVILLLRNPEETAISNYQWNIKATHPLSKYFASLTFEEGIHKIFFGIDKLETEANCDFIPLRWQYNLYADWIIKDGAFPVFFEDIIGIKGGGTLEKQVRIIKEMFAYLKEPIPFDDEIMKILDESYGNSTTFRIGKTSELPLKFKEIFEKEPIKSEVQKINALINKCKNLNKITL